MADTPSLRERVGGRWAVSWPYAASMVIVSSLTFPYATPVSGPGGVPALALMGIVSIVNLAAILLVPLAAVTVFRHRRTSPVPVWAVFALGAAVAVAREVLLRPTLALFDLRIESAVSLRLLTLMLLSGVFAVGFALLLDEIERLRRAIDQINEDLVRLREQERLGDELIESIGRAAEMEISAATSAVLDDIGDRIDLEGADQRSASTEELRAFVDVRLRPLSVELYDVEEAPVPPMRVRDVLRIGLRTRPLRPGITALLLGTVILVYQLQRFALGEALLQAATHAGIVFAVLFLVAFAARRGIARDAAIPLAVALAIVATSVKVIIVNADATIIGSGILIANGAWVITAVVAAGLFEALFTGRSKIMPPIRATLDEQAINAIAERRELVQASRDLAAYVHGTLQSTLLAVAFAIEDATRTGDDQRVLAALEAARVALRAMPETDVHATDDLAQELRRRGDQWRGYLKVTVTVACPYPIPPATIRDASSISQEALVNAHKHGHATRVQMIASMTAPDLLVLEIRDDGTGPRDGARGIGSRQLDAAAPDAWALVANPDGAGATLSARLRVRAAKAPQPTR